MEELVSKAKCGDKEAFTKLIVSIQHDLYKIAKMRLTNEADIDDAIQETMIETFRFIKKLKDESAFKPWVTKILINKCNKIYKKKRYNEISFEDEIENYLVQESTHLTESDTDFYLLVKDLNYEDRMILTLYYLERYTFNEIGKILNINENTVKTRLYRTKNKIKNKLEEGIK